MALTPVPRGVLGLALFLWGWQANMLVPGLAMALALEGHHFTRFRWDIASKEFNRVADFSGVVVFVFILLYYTKVVSGPFLWLPVGFFPLIAAQLYSVQGEVGLGAIFWTIRKRAQRGGPEGTFNFYYFYLFLVLFATVSSDPESPVVFAGVMVLVAWALWPFRSRRVAYGAWGVLLLAVAVSGLLVGYELQRLHVHLRAMAYTWYMGQGQDPDQVQTAIGAIGDLKSSNRILLRIRSEKGMLPVLRLHEASYNIYMNGRWLASKSQFTPVPPFVHGVGWRLGTAKSLGRFHVYTSFPEEKGVLALPFSTLAVDGLEYAELFINQYGAVKVEEAPVYADYSVAFGKGSMLQHMPNEMDLYVSEVERAVLAQVLSVLAMNGLSEKEKLVRIKGFFREHFQYSLSLQGGDSEALATFLYHTRSGHCEYFATATVLLLRSAGIPARYASGFLVDEFSTLEDMYVVRDRHAHAWAQAYVNGQWVTVDTTPSDWLQYEEKRLSFMSSLQDVFSWMGFQGNRLRIALEPHTPLISTILGMILVLIFGRRVLLGSGQRQERGGQSESLGEDRLLQEFAKIEAFSGELGLTREVWETERRYCQRLAASSYPFVAMDLLEEIVIVYRAQRYGRDKPSEEAVGKLSWMVEAWLKENHQLLEKKE